MTIFRDGSFKRGLKSNEVAGVGPDPIGLTAVLQRRGDGDTDTHRGTTLLGHREEAAVYTPRREASRETNLPSSGSWTSSVQRLRT